VTQLPPWQIHPATEAGEVRFCGWIAIYPQTNSQRVMIVRRKERMDIAFAHPGVVGQRRGFKRTSRVFERCGRRFVLGNSTPLEDGDEVVLQFDFGLRAVSGR